MAQKRNYATKKKGVVTETEPFWNIEDIKNFIEWFENNDEWDGYLITMLEILIGRRIGDVVKMKWSDLYCENGKKKREIDTIIEQKTGKITKLPVSSMVFEAVEIYLEHKPYIHPMDNLDDFIFYHQSKWEWQQRDKTVDYKNITWDQWYELLNKDLSDKKKDDILEGFEKQKDYETLGEYLHYEIEWKAAVKTQTDNYRKKLKKAVEFCGIEYPVSSHSLRKTFAYWIYKTHLFDPNCILSLQKLFNHATVQQTYEYIGMIEEQKRRYLEDHGNFIRDVLAGNADKVIKNMPVISMKTDDYSSIIFGVIKSIQNGEDPLMVYQAAINSGNERRIA